MRTRESKLKKWMFGLLAVLAIAIGLYALGFYGTPERVHEAPFTTDKGDLPDAWYGFLWIHAISAGIALGIGWLQFVKKLRLRKAVVHRSIGYIYSLMIIIAGVTGLYLAYYANGGLSAQIGFSALSIMWIFTLFQGLRTIIVERDPIAHGRWMVRNYALTCAAIALRIYTPLAAVFFGLEDTNDTFHVIAWLCWIPNLLIAEMLLAGRKSKRAPRTTRIHSA